MANLFPWLGRFRQNPAVRERLNGDARLRAVHERCKETDPRQWKAVPVRDSRFVVIDTEATGFHVYAGDRIISIALLEMQGLTLTGKSYTSLVNPGRTIPESSTTIHHIRDEDVVGAPALKEIIADIGEFIGDAVLVGHHLDFDLRFLNVALKKLVDCRLRNPEIDTMLLYLGYSGQIGHYTLEEVARACKVTITDRHTAEGDAMAAANIFSSLANYMVKESDPVMKLIRHQGITTSF